jgi:hypothetical protein
MAHPIVGRRTSHEAPLLAHNKMVRYETIKMIGDHKN